MQPAFKDAVFNEAAAYIKLQQYDVAIRSLELYNQLENSDYESFFLKGYLFKQLNQYEEALNNFNKCVALKPNFFEGQFNKGLA